VIDEREQYARTIKPVQISFCRGHPSTCTAKELEIDGLSVNVPTVFITFRFNAVAVSDGGGSDNAGQQQQTLIT